MMTRTMSIVELVEWLSRRIEERAPTAVVRFGDGEASLLEASPDRPESMALATSKLASATGTRFPPDAVLEIKHAVSLAWEKADVLGILFGHEIVEGRLNKLTSLYREDVAAGRPSAVLGHCLLNHDVFDALPEMLAGHRVSVISCRNVKPVLEEGWELEDVAVYPVPSQHTMRDVDGPYETVMHDVPIWPDTHARLQEELCVRETGEVFLVGAGMFGKDLCVGVREEGGIALDLGSALDRMVGKVTRGPRRQVAVLRAQGMSVPEIVAHFKDRMGIEVKPEAIAELAKKSPPDAVGNANHSGTLDFYGIPTDGT